VQYMPARHFAKGKNDPAFRTKLQIGADLKIRARARRSRSARCAPTAPTGDQDGVSVASSREAGLPFVMAPKPRCGTWAYGPDAQRLDAVNDRLKLQNDARTTLLQGLGGAVLLLGAYFTYRQLRISREQLLHTVEASDQQLRITQAGQITERFTRAIDQLGGSEDVQLGGIYALQQIAGSSPQERSAIYEILAAYVRFHSPWTGPHDSGPVDIDAIPRLREHQPGVQAAMLVLGRRLTEPSAVPLGLMGADLRWLRSMTPTSLAERTLRMRSFGAQV
jgi:hypothetical protein